MRNEYKQKLWWMMKIATAAILLFVLCGCQGNDLASRVERLEKIIRFIEMERPVTNLGYVNFEIKVLEKEMKVLKGGGRTKRNDYGPGDIGFVEKDLVVYKKILSEIKNGAIDPDGPSSGVGRRYMELRWPEGYQSNNKH